VAVEADEEALDDPEAAFRALLCAHETGAPDAQVRELQEGLVAARVRVATYERDLARRAHEGLNYGLAMRHFVHTLRYDPRDGDSAASLARLLVQAENTDGARRVLTRAHAATRLLREPRGAVERAARDLGITVP
jgi:hypothetical protein